MYFWCYFPAFSPSCCEGVWSDVSFPLGPTSSPSLRSVSCSGISEPRNGAGRWRQQTGWGFRGEGGCRPPWVHSRAVTMPDTQLTQGLCPPAGTKPWSFSVKRTVIVCWPVHFLALTPKSRSIPELLGQKYLLSACSRLSCTLQLRYNHDCPCGLLPQNCAWSKMYWKGREKSLCIPLCIFL